MNPDNFVAPLSVSDTRDKSSHSKHDQIAQNIETILAFYNSADQKISRSQRAVENFSEFLGKPLYLGSILLFILVWTLGNIFAPRVGLTAIDPAPFVWLQAMVSMGALLTSAVVLIRQNRLGKLEEQRSHLELQVNLLAEQKVTKIINLLEELRRDLPMVKDRHDPEATAFQQSADPQVVLAALDKQRATVARSKHTGEAEGKSDASE